MLPAGKEDLLFQRLSLLHVSVQKYCSSGIRRGLCAAYREGGLLYQMLSLLEGPHEGRQAQAAQQDAGQRLAELSWEACGIGLAPCCCR